MGDPRTATVVVIGAGFSGLCMGISLKKAGIHDFVILEKADEVGGVWRENTYPGLRCDIRSHLYSFSFAQDPRWSNPYASQAEIWAYLRRVADEFGLREHIRFGVSMNAERWDADRQVWEVRTGSGETYTSRFLVNSTRALFVPAAVRLKGLRSFAGETWHSAEWNHDVDLAGKRVAVIGTGASSIQIVPAIADRVASLTVYQRSAAWVLPKADYEMPAWVRGVFGAVPPLQRAYRAALYWSRELTGVPMMKGNSLALWWAERKGRRHIRRHISDPELRANLTPDYRIGCKRVLLSNDYYRALNQDNVEVVTDGITKVLPHSLVDAAGVEREADVIVFGTGFQGALQKVKIQGADGRNLWRDWVTKGAEALRGITIPGYPNLFFMHGPNSGSAHNSMVFMIEAQANFIRRAIELVESRGAAALDTRAEAHDQFQTDIQSKLRQGIWSRGGCSSWYLDDKGMNRTMWPGASWRYWLRTRKVDEREFELIAREEVSEHDTNHVQ